MDEIIRFVRKMRPLIEEENTPREWFDELEARLEVARKGLACVGSTTAPNLQASLNEQQVRSYGRVV